MALVVSSDGTLDPQTAKARNRAVVLAQGGIHAGEIDGKDAGFLLVRELLRGDAGKAVLSKLTLVFVPVFNVDGHERFGKNNRPNQRGPEEMGWRTTAGNLNLNRDYMKADCPEMAAMLKLLHAWDPIMYVDLHVTDGADFQPVIAVTVNPSLAGPESLMRAGYLLTTRVRERLEKQGHLPVSFYPAFVKDEDPASGFAAWVSPARLSDGYWGLNNRIGVLVETHSWKEYGVRVKATHDALLDLLELTAQDATDWTKAAQLADNEGASIAAKDVVLQYEPTKKAKTIDFRGYKYERVLSPVSGRFYTKYDPSQPQIWKVPLFTELKPQVTVKAPKGGYIVPAAHAGWVQEKLSLHGIHFEILSGPRVAKNWQVEAFRAEEFQFAGQPREGRQTLTVTGHWAKESAHVTEGSLFVPIHQSKARLVVYLFEPLSGESFLNWGFFNASFEKKEYLESYVAEEVARTMLAEQPGLAEEFRMWLANHPEAARDPDRRLEFFGRRHPTWDDRYALYPILRTDQ
jgi:hypothetical protein